MAKQVIDNTKQYEMQRIANPVRQRLLPLKDAATYLGRGIDSMREMVYAGVFPVIQMGERSKMWLDVQDLDEWIYKNKRALRHERTLVR